MKKQRVTVACLIATLLASTGFQAAAAETKSVLCERHTYSLDEQKAIKLNRMLADVRSPKDLEKLFKQNPDNPLGRLSPSARQRFINGLQYDEVGVSSFRYQELVDELTAPQIDAVLSLLGKQHLHGKFSPVNGVVAPMGMPGTGGCENDPKCDKSKAYDSKGNYLGCGPNTGWYCD